MDERMPIPPPVAAAGEPAAAHVPPDRAERDALRAVAEAYVAGRRLVPPLPIDELRSHARQIVVSQAVPVAYTDLLTVLVSNALWRETVARIPFERRVILLPQCLRDRAECPASIDALGVLCEQCGRCPIGALQAEAESLGYVVLVAEGTSVVTRLIESGKVDAVVGVSCLSVLERAFPHLSAEAVPGLAIPLLHDGCHRTSVDTDWVIDAIRLRSGEAWLGRADLDRLREEVRGWFAPDELDRRVGPPGEAVEQLARAWMLRGGKRWRPFLLAAVWRAMRAPEAAIPDSVRDLAIAVECFHKASLIHDDIEDEDDIRYGLATLHREHGVAAAINAGDALLGEGYRLIAGCAAPPADVRAMVEVAAEGHRTLCIGQGGELAWMREPRPLPSGAVIDIFRRKTAPAFEVALRLGALAATGRDSAVEAALRNYSSALGIAYQIRDDLDDLHEPPVGRATTRPRMSILSALAVEAAAGPTRAAAERAWLDPAAGAGVNLPEFIRTAGIADKALQMMEHHKNAAIRSLEPLQNVHLKSLLRRIVGRLVPRT
jgi:geranylgeranyl pyrophosphate synthase